MGDDAEGFHEKGSGNWKITDRIGFFGCSGRIVRIGRRAQKTKVPVQLKLDCPSCSRNHIVRPMWRERNANDPDPEVEVA